MTIDHIIAGLSESMRNAIWNELRGYPSDNTIRALMKRGLSNWNTLTPLGQSVRARLKEIEHG